MANIYKFDMGLILVGDKPVASYDETGKVYPVAGVNFTPKILGLLEYRAKVKIGVLPKPTRRPKTRRSHTQAVMHDNLPVAAGTGDAQEKRPAPPLGPYGDKTPEYVSWFFQNHTAEEFVKKYGGRKVNGVLIPMDPRRVKELPVINRTTSGNDVPDDAMAHEAEEQWLK